jgi:hypothetical protein
LFSWSPWTCRGKYKMMLISIESKKKKKVTHSGNAEWWRYEDALVGWFIHKTELWPSGIYTCDVLRQL